MVTIIIIVCLSVCLKGARDEVKWPERPSARSLARPGGTKMICEEQPALLKVGLVCWVGQATPEHDDVNYNDHNEDHHLMPGLPPLIGGNTDVGAKVFCLHQPHLTILHNCDD